MGTLRNDSGVCKHILIFAISVEVERDQAYLRSTFMVTPDSSCNEADPSSSDDIQYSKSSL